jgi:hypothetical protein
MVSLALFNFVSLNNKNFFVLYKIYVHDRKNGFMSKENSYFLSTHNFNSLCTHKFNSKKIHHDCDKEAVGDLFIRDFYRYECKSIIRYPNKENSDIKERKDGSYYLCEDC